MEASVIVAGAGPVGLSLALDLAVRGVRVTVVDRRTEVPENLPRARTLNVRNSAFMRRLGMYDVLSGAVALDPRMDPDAVFVTSMSGFEITRIADPFYTKAKDDDRFPQQSISVLQAHTERLLRERLLSMGVECHFGWTVEALAQDDARVSCTIADRSGERRELNGTYLVGCDGNSGAVRGLAGITQSGTPYIASNLQIVVRLPGIVDKLGGKIGRMNWFINEKAAGFFFPYIMRDDKYVISMHEMNPDDSPETVDVASLLRDILGFDTEFEVLYLNPWRCGALQADSYRAGRVFLAGDSAHTHAPFGGHGMNLGMGDAFNLSWKLAAVLKGWASPAILETYEDERRPVGATIVALATRLFQEGTAQKLVRPGISEDSERGRAVRKEVAELIVDSKAEQFRSIGVHLGFNYANSPIVIADGSIAPAFRADVYEPSASPGCLAPHARLRGGVSLYDRFGMDFNLLAIGTKPSDLLAQAEFIAAAGALGVPLSLVHVDEPDLLDLYGARYALIRPDQHVAWRGDELPRDPKQLLWTVTGGALGRRWSKSRP